MGKKKSKKKKGDGAKKTAEKTAKAEAKALKKELGEDDIDQLLADLRVKDAQQSVVTITACEPPTPRSGATWHPHPTKPELLLYGGELYDGRITSVYNDLFVYSIPKREWRRVSSPNCPPPRSAHQAVVRDSQESPELWVFGGEFTSPSGSQFHHYRDLWKLDLNTYQWQCYSGFAAEKSDSKKDKKAAAAASSMSSALSTSGPSARSGHRMIICKSRIFVFGGFFSRGDTTKYFDDLWCWDLESMAWLPGPIQPASALHPSARSGFGFVCNEREETAYIFGGFALEAKQKKEDPKAGAGAGKGGKSASAKSSAAQQVAVAHSDLWSLNLVNFSYSPLKKRGYFPATGRFAFGVTTQKEKARAFVFGGLKDSEQDQQQQQNKGGNRKRAGDSDDDEDDDDDLADSLATTYNDLYCFDLRKPTEGGPGQKFFFVDYKGEAKDKVAAYEVSVKKKAAAAAGAAPAAEKKEGEEAAEEESSASVFDFNPVVEGAASSSSSSSSAAAAAPAASDAAPSLSPSAPAPVPAPRRSAHLCVKNNLLFLYGGVREEGSNDVEHTFGDLWAIDVNRGAGQSWEQLMGGAAVEWAGSDAEPDEAEEEEEEEEKESERKKKAAAKQKREQAEEEEEEEEEESSSDESDEDDKPAAASSSSSSASSAASLKPTLGESLTVYFARSKAHWMSEAVGALEADRRAEEARVIAEAAEAKRVAEQEARERAQQEAELLARAGIDAEAEAAVAAASAAAAPESIAAAPAAASSSAPAPSAAVPATAPSKKDSKDREKDSKDSKKESKKDSKDSKKDKKAAKEESSSSSSKSAKSAASAVAAPSNDAAAYEKALRTKAFELASARFQQR